MFRCILRPVVRIARTGIRRSSDEHIPRQYRPGHMDELSIPSGCWQTAHQNAQKKYNRQLIVGIVTLIATIAFGRYTELLWLNYLPPVPKEDK